MATALARRFESARPYDGGSFKKVGSEEAHTVETFERRIHGTPEIEPHREFSSNQYTERRTYGRDENGELVVKIEKDPKEPVRPVSPVRPLAPMGREDNVHLLKPAKPLEVLPLSIPRIEHHNRRSYSAAGSPRSIHIETEHSPRSVESLPMTPRSSASSGVSISSSIPMKKIIRKSRLVSVYDGLPLTPYTETVTYEPKYQGDYHDSRNSLYPINAGAYGNGWHTPSRSRSASRAASRLSGYSPARRHVTMADECAVIIENPLYRN